MCRHSYGVTHDERNIYSSGVATNTDIRPSDWNRKYIQRTSCTVRLHKMINKVYLHVNHGLLGAISIALS